MQLDINSEMKIPSYATISNNFYILSFILPLLERRPGET
jgi:hypothetical protein